MADDLFDAGTPDTPVATPNDDPSAGNPYEALVGEGKKFKDNVALAQGKLESDRFISQLQRELEELRGDLRERLTLEQVMQKLEEQKGTANPPREPDAGEGVENDRRVTMDEVQKLVQNTISQNNELNTQKSNVDNVKDRLKRVWGNGYADKLNGKLAELGIGKEFANGLAATQPKVFLTLMGVDAQSQAVVDTAPPSSSVRPAQHGERRNYAFFQKMRKDNPSLYFSPSTQNELHKLAMEQGEEFYKP